MSQVALGLLHGLHAGVDGPHQGLLSQTLTSQTTHKYITHGVCQCKAALSVKLLKH